MDGQTKFQGWIATLSDGGIRFERQMPNGEKSAWQSLLDELTAKNLRITQLRLQRDGFAIICDAQKRCDGYVQAYDVQMSLTRNIRLTTQGVGTIYGDTVFMTWVDSSGNVRQSIHNLADLKIHSTLRDHHAITSDNTS